MTKKVVIKSNLKDEESVPSHLTSIKLKYHLSCRNTCETYECPIEGFMYFNHILNIPPFGLSHFNEANKSEANLN